MFSPEGVSGKKSDADDEIEVIEDDDEDDEIGDDVVVAAQPVLLDNPEIVLGPKKTHRPKLLQFDENQRPPYWGTW